MFIVLDIDDGDMLPEDIERIFRTKGHTQFSILLILIITILIMILISIGSSSIPTRSWIVTLTKYVLII